LLEQQQQLWCVPGGGRVIESRWCWDDVRWHNASAIYINICVRVCVCSTRMWIGQTRDVQSWKQTEFKLAAHAPLYLLCRFFLSTNRSLKHTRPSSYTTLTFLSYIYVTRRPIHGTRFFSLFILERWKNEETVFSALSIAHLIMASTRCTLISKAMKWREKWLHSWYKDMFGPEVL
jgi:hypothetical protein